MAFGTILAMIIVAMTGLAGVTAPRSSVPQVVEMQAPQSSWQASGTSRSTMSNPYQMSLVDTIEPKCVMLIFRCLPEVDMRLIVNGVDVIDFVEINKSERINIKYSVAVSKQTFVDSVEFEVEAESVKGKAFLALVESMNYVAISPLDGKPITITNPIELEIKETVDEFRDSDELTIRPDEFTVLIGNTNTSITKLIPDGVYNLKVIVVTKGDNLFQKAEGFLKVKIVS